MNKNKTAITGSFLQELKQSFNDARIVLLLIALLMAPLIYLTFNRLFQDFEISAVGYQHMDMIDQILQGKPVYAPLSVEFSAVTYTPLYWYMCAFVFKLFGASFVAARFVSLIGTIIFLATIAAFIWKTAARNLLLAVVAPCVILLTATVPGYNWWPTEINVNGVHFAFVALGFYLLQSPLTVRRTFFSALFLCLATLTKQTGMAYVCTAGVLVLLLSRKYAILYAFVSLIVLLGAFLVLNISTHGEFYRQVVTSNQGPPWLLSRLFDEVIKENFFGLTGVMALLTYIRIALDLKRKGGFKNLLRADYFLCATGVIVACIAHPKYGSGPNHDVIALTGFVICGSIGLYQLTQLLPPEFRRSLLISVPLLQLAVAGIATINNYPKLLIDSHDRIKNDEIAAVFSKGQTCFYATPYIEKHFGQLAAGTADDEACKWNNGQLDYSSIPDFLSTPFRRQAYDYVIIGSYRDPQHPVMKTIMENYQVIHKLPAHPIYPWSESMRHDCYILAANRLLD
ncbi:MAG: hypothetical protein EOM20_00345 [Spartobacteria bacterium]|nr:hypothetical protein [Spartobacteria bacterium]